MYRNMVRICLSNSRAMQGTRRVLAVPAGGAIVTAAKMEALSNVGARGKSSGLAQGGGLHASQTLDLDLDLDLEMDSSSLSRCTLRASFAPRRQPSDATESCVYSTLPHSYHVSLLYYSIAGRRLEASHTTSTSPTHKV